MIFKITMKIILILTSFLFFACPAAAEVWSSPEAAMTRAYGEGCRFQARSLTLTAAESRDLELKSGARVLDPCIHYFEVWAEGGPKGLALMDEEMGKHQAISLLVSLDLQARILRLEVLVYRERYGAGVRAAKFTGQFEGKVALDPLRIGKDLDAVS